MVDIPITNDTHAVQSVVVQKKKPKTRDIFVLIFVVVVLSAVGYLAYQNYMLAEQKMSLENILFQERTSHAKTSGELYEYQEKYAQTKEERDQLEHDLNGQVMLVNAIKDQVAEMGGTLNILDKLSKTDPELLQKYSKVFFLNEHYRPASFKQIDQKFVYPDRDLWIHGEVWLYLEDLLQSASSSGVDMLVLSAFRSFDTQAKIKDSYTVTYGTGANQFSADQGYSEHQLGTTVDLTTSVNGNSFHAFDETEAYQWLLDNAHIYGYVMSYPEDNGYYLFEPWHWRFVGRELATRLYEEEMYFYDMDQREIDKYLVSFFD